MKLGIITDCLKKKNVEECIRAAARLGIEGVQIYAVAGEFCHAALDDAAIEKYRALLRECNLKISALCAEFGGHGFARADEAPERIVRVKEIIDLAVKFDSNVVTTHIGVIPEDKECETYKIMLDTLTQCGNYAASKGVTIAIETGPEMAPVLNDFVIAAGDGVGVNLDPANFVMVTGQDPAEAVRILGKKIVHTHVKDGKMLKKTDPAIIYNFFADGGIEALNVADYFIETPVGEGDVNWEEYIGALREIGYNGYLTIEREAGDKPEADIAMAVSFIKDNGYLN